MYVAITSWTGSLSRFLVLNKDIEYSSLYLKSKLKLFSFRKTKSENKMDPLCQLHMPYDGKLYHTLCLVLLFHEFELYHQFIVWKLTKSCIQISVSIKSKAKSVLMIVTLPLVSMIIIGGILITWSITKSSLSPLLIQEIWQDF